MYNEIYKFPSGRKPSICIKLKARGVRNMIWELFFSILSIFISQVSIGQNLVINPSFEAVLNCPVRITSPCCTNVNLQTFPNANSVTNWHSIFLSSDYYNSCGIDGLAIPSSSAFFITPGNQPDPRTGEGYAGIISFRDNGSSAGQEYIMGNLSSPLIIGQEYGVEFYAYLSSNSKSAISSLGALFLDAPITSPNNQSVFSQTGQSFDIVSNSVIDHQSNWTQVCGTFTATSTSEYIVIGNIFSDQNTPGIITTGISVLPGGSNAWSGAYYFIDDINVEPIGLTSNFCEMSTLPVELADFKAEQKSGFNEIKWTTFSETNNEYFSLLHRDGNGDFIEIKRIFGQGNSTNVNTYSYKHPFPEEIEYYKLKQVDFDGQFEYSNVISLKRKISQDIVIYPNPSDNLLMLEGDLKKFNTEKWMLNDVMGKNVSSMVQLIWSSESKIQLNISLLETGIYYLIINDNSYKIMKN